MSSYNGCFMKKRKKLRERNVIKYGQLTCEYCGKANLKVGNGREESLDLATIDHFIPLEKGGNNAWINLYVCCLECNNKKSNLLPSEFKTNYYNKQLNILLRKL